MSSAVFSVMLILLFGSIVSGTVAVALPASQRRQVDKTVSQLKLYEQGLVTERDVRTTTLFERIPLLSRNLVRLGRALSPGSMVKTMETQLVYAGIPREVERYLAIKGLAFLGAMALVFVLATALRDSSWRLLACLLAGAACLLSPDVVLKRRAGNRQKEIRIALPGMLEILAVSVEAGLGFDSALARLIAKNEGPLPEEFARMLKEMQMGVNRRDAFQNLSSRVDVPELQSFLSAMIQADVLGVSIADTLRIQAREIRTRRYQKAEETAQKMPVKLVFPTVLCIFPALFVVLLGPAAIRIARAILGISVR